MKGCQSTHLRKVAGGGGGRVDVNTGDVTVRRRLGFVVVTTITPLWDSSISMVYSSLEGLRYSVLTIY